MDPGVILADDSESEEEEEEDPEELVMVDDDKWMCDPWAGYFYCVFVLCY